MVTIATTASHHVALRETIYIPNEPTEDAGEEQPDSQNAPVLMNRSVLRTLKLLIEVGKHPEGTSETDVVVLTEPIDRYFRK